MTALFEQVADYLLRWSVWLGVIALLAGAVAIVAWLAASKMGWGPSRWTAFAGPAMIGAIVLASLAHRFEVTGPQFDVWRRSLPWMWVLIGAGAAAALTSVRHSRA